MFFAIKLLSLIKKGSVHVTCKLNLLFCCFFFLNFKQLQVTPSQLHIQDGNYWVPSIWNSTFGWPRTSCGYSEHISRWLMICDLRQSVRFGSHCCRSLDKTILSLEKSPRKGSFTKVFVMWQSVFAGRAHVTGGNNKRKLLTASPFGKEKEHDCC